MSHGGGAAALVAMGLGTEAQARDALALVDGDFDAALQLLLSADEAQAGADEPPLEAPLADEKVVILVELGGCSLLQATKALARARGDVEAASERLLEDRDTERQREAQRQSDTPILHRAGTTYRASNARARPRPWMLEMIVLGGSVRITSPHLCTSRPSSATLVATSTFVSPQRNLASADCCPAAVISACPSSSPKRRPCRRRVCSHPTSARAVVSVGTNTTARKSEPSACSPPCSSLSTCSPRRRLSVV